MATTKARQLAMVGTELTEEYLLPHKTIGLAVSGDVSLDRLETRIIDTADFQRLRSIKVLGSSYLVYPTAVHTRFDHSLGALKMAQEIMRAVMTNGHSEERERRISTTEQQLIRLYALLHDIAHIPFGHTLEDELCILPRHDEDADRLKRFVGDESVIGRIVIEELGVELHERFLMLYNPYLWYQSKHPAGKKEGSSDRKLSAADILGDSTFMYDIVSNTVCADLLDYLRRDAHFCNLRLDTSYRFLNYLYIAQDPTTKSKRLAVRLWKEGARPAARRDLLSELVRLLDNRYLLGERVYFHHAKLSSGTMIGAAVQRAKDDQKLKAADLYEMGDEGLLDRLIKIGGTPSRLARAIRERRLWKRGPWERGISDMEAEQGRAQDVDVSAQLKQFWQDAGRRRKEEDYLAGSVMAEDGAVLFHCPSQKMALKLADMKVFWHGTLMPLRECSDPVVQKRLASIESAHTSLWKVRVFTEPDLPQTAADQIRNGCERLFCYDVAEKQQHDVAFLRSAVRMVIDDEQLATPEMSEYTMREKRALEAVLSSHEAVQSIDLLRGLVRGEFQKP